MAMFQYYIIRGKAISNLVLFSELKQQLFGCDAQLAKFLPVWSLAILNR